MKFADPCRVSCPACGQRCEVCVEALLARGVRCPACDQSLDEIGADMQRALDREAGFVIFWGLQAAIEKRWPDLHLTDTDIVPDDRFEEICLELVIVATERRLAGTVKGKRRQAALEIVETAFRDEFPDMDPPPPHVLLIGYLQSAPHSLFGPKILLSRYRKPQR